METLKKRWNINSNFQLIIILIVFAVTGTTAAKITGPVISFMGIAKNDTHPLLYWSFKILAIFPLYQILLLFFGWLFGQFAFFWNFEKKLLSRLGLKFLFKKG